MPSQRPASLSAVVAALTFARLVVNTAQRLVSPFLPAIARGLGISLERAGVLVSVRWLAGLATPAVVAAMGRGERRVRLAMAGLAFFGLGAAVTAWSGVYAGAVAGFALMGLGKPAFDIAAQSYVADRTPYARRARYLSILELTWGGGLVVGAPVVGWLISRHGWQSPFWVVAGLAVVSAGALLWLMEGDRRVAATAPGRLRLTTSAAALLGVAGLFSFAAEVVVVVFGAWLEDSYGLSLLALGATSMLVGLSEMAGEGATLAVTDRLGKRRAVGVGLGVSALGYGMVATEPGTVGVGLALISVALFAFEFTVVSAIPLATEVVPAARSRYLAIFVVAMGIGRAAGSALGAVVFGAFGLAGNALLAAVANLAALALLVAWVREADEPTAAPAGPPGREKLPNNGVETDG